MFVPIFYKCTVNSTGYTISYTGGLTPNPDGNIERRRFTYDTVAQFNEMHRKIGTPDENDSVLEFCNAWGHLFYDYDYRFPDTGEPQGNVVMEMPVASLSCRLMELIQRKVQFPEGTPIKPKTMNIVYEDYEERKKIPHVAPMNLFLAIYHASQFAPDTKYRVCEYRRRHKKARPRIGSTCPAGCIISTGRTGKAIWGDGCRQYEKTKTSRAKKKKDSEINI